MSIRLLASYVKSIMTTQNFNNCSFKGGIKSKVFSIIAVFFFAVVLSVLFTQESLAAKEPVITYPEQGQRFSSPMPEIRGQAQDASQVMVYIDNILNGKAIVKDGKFSYKPFLPLSSGDHEISVKSEVISFPVLISIIPNPSPILLVPDQGARLGQDRAWIGGVAKNNSLVRILVDGKETARVMVKNSNSGTGSFGAQIKGLEVGGHIVAAIARDWQGKESFASEVLAINVLPPTPAPVLFRPIVNSDSGIERPFIAGIAKNNFEVSIIIDGKMVQKMPLGADPSGAISFAWQPKESLSLGKHKIEAFASDKGKLSNNSAPIYWQVGEISEALPESSVAKPIAKEEQKPAPEVEDKDKNQSIVETDKGKELIVSEGEKKTPLTVKEELKENKEEPVVPDESAKENKKEPEGRVIADDDSVLGAQDKISSESEQKNEQTAPDEIKEITPGAVKREASKIEEEPKFTFNTSLVIGIVILAFLLLSILIWYIQEKRAELGDKVVNIFREDEDKEDSLSKKDSSEELKLNTDSIRPPVRNLGEKEALKPKEDQKQENFVDEEKDWRRDDSEDLPPPPPPMF